MPAFDQIWQSMRRPVLALGLRMLGQPSDAEDVVQETFLAVHRALPRFRGDAAVSTWVYRIALRAAMRVKARAAARRRSSQPLSEEPAGTAPSGIDAADRRETLDNVRRAVHALPAEHAAVMALLSLDELSAEEVAKILDIPVGTVWSRAHHARKLLRTRLG